MTSKFKTIRHFLKKRSVKQFGFFVLIAFVFLMFTKLTISYKQNLKLQLHFKNLNKDIVIKNDSLNYINAYVEAKGFSLFPYTFSKTKIINLDSKKDVNTTANTFRFTPNLNRYTIEQQLGEGFKIISLKPDTLYIPYSKQASKIVPLHVEKNIEFVSGYNILNNLKQSHDSIKIIGSTDIIDTINSVSTKPLNLQLLKTNIDTELALEQVNNVTYTPNTIKVTATVERFTEGTIEVPITVVNLPKNTTINYFPKTVSVNYYVALKEYKNVVASDFTIQCDYKELNNQENYLIPKIISKPEAIKRISIKQKHIDFIKL